MKKRTLLALVACSLIAPSGLAADYGEPQGLFYVKFPFGSGSASERAPYIGLTLNSRSASLDFSLGAKRYRRNVLGDSTMDPLEASELNWWLIGGLAAAVVLVASARKSDKDEQHPCLAINPPPPGC
jgi:hypothetical protein